MRKALKTLLIVIVLFMEVILLAGCGKGNNSLRSKFIGTWKYSDESGSLGATYVLKKDGTGSYEITVGKQSDKKNITYKVDEKKLYVTFENDTDVFESKYTFKDGNLIIEDSFGEKMTFIKK